MLKSCKRFNSLNETIPWGHTEGVYFPSLDKVAKEFAENNGLRLLELVCFNTRDPTEEGIYLNDLHRYTGKILRFNKGLAILTNRITIHGLDNL